MLLRFLKQIFIAIPFIVIATHTAIAEEKVESNLTFLLPIDWTQDQHVNLSVSIPDNYKALQPAAVWDKTPLLEFIPKNENEDAWSEIITVQLLRGKSIAAEQITRFLLEQITAKASKVQVLFNKQAKTNYQISTLIMNYTYDNKEEIIEAKYFSGPYDCVGVQYTVRPSKNQKEKEIVKKIQDFFNQNVQVIEANTTNL